MSKRMRVLMSAYSCEPGKGSEPEVGWRWALQMARFHDVLVVTRANNASAIRAALDKYAGPKPEFLFHDLSERALALKRQFRMHVWYYQRWQRSAWRIIAEACSRSRFDLLHHVSYAGVRYRSAVFGHGVPAIWGPVGGLETMPRELLPWNYPLELLKELGRDLHGRLVCQGGTAARYARSAALVIASNRETAAAMRPMRADVEILPTIGIDVREYTQARSSAPARPGAPLRLLFAGRLVYWKGVELALRALHAADVDARLAFVGEGPFAGSARELTAKLGLSQKVEFRGRVDRSAMASVYQESDALLFPSMHESGGFTVIEAMASELPVICLDRAGPALSVADGCGFRVPIGSKAEVIARLSEAIRRYGTDRSRCVADGLRAREYVEQSYDWDRKGELMSALYARAAGQ